MKRLSRTAAARRRAGSIYLVVLGTGMLIAVLGLASLTLGRVQRRAAESTADMQQAQLYARAAVELGLLKIKSDSAWRTTLTSGTWEVNRPIGAGTYTLEGIDPDGNLANSATDSLTLIGTGLKGQARQKIRVQLLHDPKPLDILQSCLHAHAGIVVAAGSGKSLTVTGGPASTNGGLLDGGTIVGNVETVSGNGSVSIVGTSKLLPWAKEMPAADVFQYYKDRATTIPASAGIVNRVLTPGLNPWGSGLNADGVYFVDAGLNDLVIKASRIQGTLIVKLAASKKLIIDDAAFLESARADYPTLLVEGHLELLLKSGEYALRESNWSMSFNPAGAPYDGVADADTLDAYPNEVRGLVHIRGDATLGQSARVQGSMIVEGAARCLEAHQMVHVPSLYSNPPPGYRSRAMRVAPGSWQQAVD